MIATNPERLLTTREVAAELRVHPVSVYRFVKAGALQARRLGESGPLRFDPSAVDAFVRAYEPARGDEAA